MYSSLLRAVFFQEGRTVGFACGRGRLAVHTCIVKCHLSCVLHHLFSPHLTKQNIETYTINLTHSAMSFHCDIGNLSEILGLQKKDVF